MNKSNLELLKQAISEGLSESFDAIANGYSGEIVCSKKHRLAMRAIVYGKAAPKRLLSPRIRRVIAIFVAAALLLTSCGIAFRDEIREAFFRLRGDEYLITYPGENGLNHIEEIYELTYVPNGYTLKKINKTNLSLTYTYCNENDEEAFFFDQGVIDGLHAINSNSIITQTYIYEYEIYCANYKDQAYTYAWNDGKYSLQITSYKEITTDELKLIIDGIESKPNEQVEKTNP